MADSRPKESVVDSLVSFKTILILRMIEFYVFADTRACVRGWAVSCPRGGFDRGVEINSSRSFGTVCHNASVTKI